MTRPCTVCRHPDRKEIDHALFRGEPTTTLAKRYQGQLTRRSLHRHYTNHVVPLLAKAKQVDELAHADSILARLDRLEKRMWRILDNSEKAGEYAISVQSAREIRGCLEMCAKLAGQIQDQTVVNVIMTQEWTVLQQIMLSVLEHHPAARIAVAQALANVGDGYGEAGRA